ncbi:MAG: rhodanese-like domain-containing protein [Solirubrobacterales bacterium]|nr:rhodanese-like domain-containing protein [Solirubrobacterales bacterium]
MSDAAPEQELELSADRTRELLGQGALLVDVRQDNEWEAGRIPGSIHVEMNELTSRAGEIPRDRPLVFVCRGGSRSAMAAQAFREAGYDAHSLSGGVTAWSDEARPLEPPGGEIVAPPLAPR